MSNPIVQPVGESARVLLDKAEGALVAYKAAVAEQDQGKADAAFAEFERLEGLAKASMEADKRAARAGEFGAYKAALSESAGRVAVGGTMPADDSGDPGIIYKAKDGSVGRFTPSRSVRRGWTAKAEAAYTDAFRRYMAGDPVSADEQAMAVQKGLSVGDDTKGGFWVVPEVFASEMISTLQDEVLMRRLGTVLPGIPRGASLSIGVNSGLGSASWGTELAIPSADTATPAGKRTLTPHPKRFLVKASNTFLDAYPGGEAYIRGEAAIALSELEETAFMTGSGAGQPQGVFASTSTLPTDVTCVSATDIAYADLLGVEGALKAQYRAGASWIMHRTIAKELFALNDGVGVPLIRRDPAAPMRFDLFGYPINLSEYAPSSSATGLYVAALGNWKRAYRIVDSLAMRMQKLVELYHATDEVGFSFVAETDGAIVDGQGIIRLKMA